MALLRVDIEGRMFTIVNTGHKELSHAVYLACSTSYCLTDEKGESESPEVIASQTDKIIYTYDSVDATCTRRGQDTGSGCVVCFMDTSNKWWLVCNESHTNDLIAVFHPDSDVIMYFDSILVDNV